MPEVPDRKKFTVSHVQKANIWRFLESSKSIDSSSLCSWLSSEVDHKSCVLLFSRLLLMKYYFTSHIPRGQIQHFRSTFFIGSAEIKFRDETNFPSIIPFGPLMNNESHHVTEAFAFSSRVSLVSAFSLHFTERSYSICRLIIVTPIISRAFTTSFSTPSSLWLSSSPSLKNVTSSYNHLQ
jgi:hypothetical protein